jgi:hypothetical protein
MLRGGRWSGLAAVLAAVAGLVGAAPPAAAVGLTPANTTSWLGPWDMPFAGIESIATSPSGDYVYVGSAGKVIQYSDTGVWVRTWSPYFPSIPGLATDPSGNVYVADGANGVVQKFDAEGGHIATWSVPGVRQIAADKHGHLFMVVSVVLASIVDVRSYAGVDLGAWSTPLPDRWWHYSGYQSNATTAVRAIATDASGNVVLAGVSSQRLDGAGPSVCLSQFELTPEYAFEFDDPLKTGEIATFSPTGASLGYGWLTDSSQSCVPGWYSYGTPNGVAVAPDDGALWVALGEHFVRAMVSVGSSVNKAGDLGIPCGLCKEPPIDNFGMPGPEAFDCHGNLFVGTGNRVLEYRNASHLTCPTKASRLGELALAPELFVTVHKKKPKKLALNAACRQSRCSLAVQITARSPGCTLGACVTTLASGRFTLSGGRPHTLSLGLTSRGVALLGHNPLLGLTLSARLLRHGRAFGPTFHPLRNPHLLGLAAIPLALSCPARGAIGTPLTVSGSIGLGRARRLSLTSLSPGGTAAGYVVPVDKAGHFTLTVVPNGSGTWTFDVHFPGDRAHAPAGAACSSDVPGPPVGPRRKPPPPPPPPPVTTMLALTCPTMAGPQEFTGTVTPTLAEASITIVYHYTDIHLEAHTLTDSVNTTAAGSYHDTGPLTPLETLTGEATASWPGRAGYTGATSSTCEF